MEDRATTAAACALLALLSGCSAQVYHGRPHYLRPLPGYSQRNSTLFGYSLAVHRGGRALLVGAPIASSIGQVFSCPLAADSVALASNATCANILINKFSVNKIHLYKNGKQDYSDQDSWLGAAIADVGDDKFVTCAPRWAMSYAKFEDFYSIFGMCYVVNGETGISSEIVTPKDEWNCKMCPNEDPTGNGAGFGWSLTVNNDKLRVGGPAVCTSGTYFDGYISANEYKEHQVTFAYDIFENDCNIPKPVPPTANFGYAISRGYFLSSKLEMFAVSSLYGKHGIGTVSLMYEGAQMKIIRDNRVGSMFGAALCSVDVNDDDLTDLLVGAPAYTDSVDSPEEGAVFLYLGTNNIKRSDLKLSATLVGAKNKPRSYFGSAIANLGDLDGDDRDEFAVGAPFEDDVGTVYVFRGSVLDGGPGRRKYWQRVSSGVRGFGASIAMLPDIDGNSCNEMAVGAIDEAAVLVLRCPIIITVTLMWDTYLQTLWKLSPSDASFKFSSCVKVKYPNNTPVITGGISVTTKLSDSGATLQLADRDYETPLPESDADPICQDITVHTKVPFELYKMTISMEVKMVKDCFQGEYDRSCAVPGPRSLMSDEITVITQRGCDKVCNPKLDFDMSLDGGVDPRRLEVGSRDSVAVRLRINNSDDSAYDWCMILSVDGAVFSPSPEANCQLNSMLQEYLCKPKPILKGSIKVFSLIVFTDLLTSETTSVVVKAGVKSKCNGDIIDRKLFTMNFFADPGLIGIKSGYGKSAIDIDTIYVENLDQNTKFGHTYTIYNNGPSTWVNFQLKIALKIHSYLRFGTPYAEDVTCNEPYASDQDLVIRCSLNKIKPSHQVELFIPLVVVNAKDGTDLDKDVNITTFAELSHSLFTKNGEIKLAQINTVLRQKVKIKWWHILLACLLALILLAVLIFVLYKSGFFYRQVKKKLQDEKRKSTTAHAQHARMSSLLEQ